MAKTYTDPRLTFSALANILAPHGAPAMMNIIADSKYPKVAQVISYADGCRAMAAFLAGAPPIAASLEPHEIELFKLLKATPPKLPKGVSLSLPGPANAHPKWSLSGVELSIVPDLLVSGPNGTGALKFHCAQAVLGRGVPKAMAELLHHYLHAELKKSSTVPEYCIVYSIRHNKLQSAAPVKAKLAAQATAACKLVAAVWPAI
jgi:hypothetical protein